MDAVLYPGIAFSPQAALADNIGAADTIIKVSDISAFPPAPNLATIGTDEEGETILYTAKTDTALSGCTRGVEGTAKAWSAGESIGRNFTAKDHNDLIAAIRAAKVDVDDTPAKGSPNPVSSGGTYAGLATKQDTLTGLPGQVVRFDGMGLPYAAEGWSGRNLLLNWDFRRPVNRDGAGTWSIGVGVDCWIISTTAKDGMYAVVNPGYLTLQYISGISEFYQAIRGSVFESLRGKTVTLSCLINSDVHTLTTHIPESGPVELSIQLPSGWLLGVYSNGNGFSCARIYAVSEADTVALYAAKLELGDHQTLARQNEDGEWELIDPPDYDLQYALCSLYSPSTGEWVGYQHSNLNLLDNWYWADKSAIINQRGQDEYGPNGYSIDGWKTSGGIARLSVMDEYIEFETATSGAAVDQHFEYIEPGKTYSFSAIVRAVTGTAGIQVYDGTAYAKTVYIPAGDNYNLLHLTFVAKKSSNVFARIRCTVAGSVVQAKAAKLELGPVQTLAHQDADGNWVLNDPPPDKALELAKCQRRQLALKTGTSGYNLTFSAYVSVNGTALIAQIPLPVPMRARPTVSFSDDLSMIIRCVDGYPSFADSSGRIDPSSASVSVAYEPGNSQLGLIFRFDSNKFSVNNAPASLSISTGSIMLDANL